MNGRPQVITRGDLTGRLPSLAWSRRVARQRDSPLYSFTRLSKHRRHSPKMNSEHRKTFEQFQDASSLQEVLQIFPEARELANPDVTQQPMRYDVFIYRFMQFFEAATHLILYERQPHTCRISGSSIGVIIAPTLVPALKIPVATARSPAGNHRRVVLTQAG